MKITARNKNPYRLFLLALCAISFALAGCLRAGMLIYNVNVPFSSWLFAVLVMGAFLALAWGFEKFYWKWPIFRRWGIVNFPDLSGRWVGFLTSSYRRNEQNVVVPISLEISQDASSVFVRACFERAKSDSIVAEFEDVDGKPFLYYVYDNAIKKKTLKHRGRDKGVVMLEYFEDEKNQKRQLKGTYFNDAAPQANHGEIEVLYSGPKLYLH
ncbi:MAG: hypothetical protein JW893_08060 [Candidatus Omnitrophica bacterium]|nr:hypothetical protein [Candidatus Omnitrophota bacterium]